MKVLIVGGGIGGMTAALSLEAAGIDAEVFEQASAIEALGVGINLQPNAVRELIELDLADDLGAIAIETSTLGYYNRFGQLIWSEPRGRAAGYAWPQYSIDRGDLQMICSPQCANELERRAFSLDTGLCRSGNRPARSSPTSSTASPDSRCCRARLTH